MSGLGRPTFAVCVQRAITNPNSQWRRLLLLVIRCLSAENSERLHRFALLITSNLILTISQRPIHLSMVTVDRNKNYPASSRAIRRTNQSASNVSITYQRSLYVALHTWKHKLHTYRSDAPKEHNASDTSSQSDSLSGNNRLR